jgi:hypothetical protein
MQRLLLLVVVVFVVSGCTFSTIKPGPDGVLAPPNKPAFIVLGNVRAADPQWQPYPFHFARGFEEWFRKNPGVPDAVTDRSAPFPADAVILTGTITEVDKGSPALRWLVGMGAGQAHVKGDFEIMTVDGQVLTQFNARESYLGGAGFRGGGFLDMEDVVGRLAETVAKATRKWANGEPID